MKHSFGQRIYSRGDSHESGLTELEKPRSHPDTQHGTFLKRGRYNYVFLPCQTVSWVVQNLPLSVCMCVCSVLVLAERGRLGAL